MRTTLLLLLFVCGLGVAFAGYCYEKQSYRSWWRTKYRSVKKCCPGYCGPNCACTYCWRTTYYTGYCCGPYACKSGRTCPPMMRSASGRCHTCIKSRRQRVCCD